MPEENENTQPGPEWADGSGDVNLSGRIELLAVNIGVGDHLVLVDPEHETAEEAAGVTELGTAVIIDMMGHIHLPGLPCIPTKVPFLLSSETLDEFVSGLQNAQREIKEHDAAGPAEGGGQ